MSRDVVLCAFALGWALPAAANEFEFTFVPIGGAEVNGGELVAIEVFLTNISQVSYQIYGVFIDVNCALNPIGSATGTITTGVSDADPLSQLQINATSSTGLP
jgi:hypothetical protein